MKRLRNATALCAVSALLQFGACISVAPIAADNFCFDDSGINRVTCPPDAGADDAPLSDEDASVLDASAADAATDATVSDAGAGE